MEKENLNDQTSVAQEEKDVDTSTEESTQNEGESSEEEHTPEQQARYYQKQAQAMKDKAAKAIRLKEETEKTVEEKLKEIEDWKKQQELNAQKVAFEKEFNNSFSQFASDNSEIASVVNPEIIKDRVLDKGESIEDAVAAVYGKVTNINNAIKLKTVKKTQAGGSQELSDKEAHAKSYEERLRKRRAGLV